MEIDAEISLLSCTDCWDEDKENGWCAMLLPLYALPCCIAHLMRVFAKDLLITQN